MEKPRVKPLVKPASLWAFSFFINSQIFLDSPIFLTQIPPCA